MSVGQPSPSNGTAGRVYRHHASGQLYRELGEAFSHPDGAREGRIDVVCKQLGSQCTASGEAATLVTVPFAELHGSGTSPAWEVVEDSSAVSATTASGPMEWGPRRLYRHFKGKFYEELGRAKSIPAGAEEVVYRTLYPSSFVLFTRPKDNFEGEVGERAPGKRRFTEVAAEELSDEAQRRVAARVRPAVSTPLASPGGVALVTGASAGLGRSTAKRLAQAGFLVFAAARSAERLAEELCQEAETASDGPCRVLPLHMDVCSADSVQAAFKEVRERAGRLDVLVNNAGVLVVGTVEMVSVEQAQNMFETNLFGAMRCMHEALPVMRSQQSGCIVNVSTIFSEIPTMNQPVYAASKAALDSLTLGTREAVRPFGIRVHSVQPGGITDTAIGANLKNGDRFGGAVPNPYPIDDMVKESVFDRIIPHGQKSAEVAEVIVDIALGKVDAPLVQTSDFTRELAEKKLKDVTGGTLAQMRF